MRLTRGLLVLAIVAALWGAPSSVSAGGNEVSSPQVSPTSGSVTTLFTFRVRYDGGFPAATVRVSVAGISVPMLLESGTLEAGWWFGSTLLPTGAWSTSFIATAVQGPSATIPGPVVIVAGLAPTPTASLGSAPGSGATPESAPVGGPDGPTAPPAAPAPSPQEVAATATVVASPAPATPAADHVPGSSIGSGGADAPAQGGSPSTPAPGGGGGTPAGGTGGGGDHAPAGQDASPPAAPGTPAPGGDPSLFQPASDTDAPPATPTTADDMVSDVLLIGLAGVASVAILGTLLLLAGRRREPDPVPATSGRATGAPSAVAETAMRRLARTSRGRAAGDPIVAALGVDDEMAARRAIRRSLRESASEAQLPTRRPRQR